MRVSYELPPDVAFAAESRAGTAQVSVDEYVAEHLRDVVIIPTVRQRVREAVEADMCDADIAAMMHYTPGRIASIRRSMGLPPNRRYRKRALSGQEGS